MTISFAIIAVFIVASAVAAMTMRNLVHCALSLILTFAGLAALYLQLSAQFVGFAQILVYVGAVAILIVFAILLTRGSEPHQQPIVSSGWIAGTIVAVAVFALLASMIASTKALATVAPEAPPAATVEDIGHQLMTRYVLPLEVIGLLLTAALIGAVIVALREGEPAPSAATHVAKEEHP
jgi:NADH-quinone oxidoreductase subunit J